MPQRIWAKPARRLILIGLLVPCVLAGVPAILAYRAERRLTESFHWVSHTLEVQHQLQGLLSVVVDAESGMRGFLLTSHDSYLEPYRSALDQLSHRIAVLRSLTSDNPIQQENFQQLNPLVATKLDLMAQTISLQKEGNHEAALALISTDRGKESMDAIRARLELMEQEESRLLVIRQQLLASRAKFGMGSVFGLVALNVLFVLAILILLRRLSRVQDLVTICAWSRTVEYQGEWLSFEKYLLRRFHLDATHGISPAEAEKAFGTSVTLRNKAPSNTRRRVT